jgi:hypothetical protein
MPLHRRCSRTLCLFPLRSVLRPDQLPQRTRPRCSPSPRCCRRPPNRPIQPDVIRAPARLSSRTWLRHPERAREVALAHQSPALARSANVLASLPSSSCTLSGSSSSTGVPRQRGGRRLVRCWACRSGRRRSGSRTGAFFFFAWPRPLGEIPMPGACRRAKAKLLDGKGKPKPVPSPPRTPPELRPSFEMDLQKLIHEDDGA